MQILMHNEVYQQEMHRQANQERLVRLAQKHPSRHPRVYRPLLAELGRQMSHLGDHLQEQYRDETLHGLVTES